MFPIKDKSSLKKTFIIPPAVCEVDIDRYLGTWFEIARFDHIFERGLEDVTATYQKTEHSYIRVLNGGFKNGRQSSAKGRAYSKDIQCKGNLLVSFFPLFKSLYRIIKIDLEHYQYAIVTSGQHYLWILARNPKIEDKLYQSLLDFLILAGYDITKLIQVKHTPQE